MIHKKRENKCEEPSDCPGWLLEGVSRLYSIRGTKTKFKGLTELCGEKQKFPGATVAIIFKRGLETGLWVEKELRGGEGISANCWPCPTLSTHGTKVQQAGGKLLESGSRPYNSQSLHRPATAFPSGRELRGLGSLQKVITVSQSG